MRLLPLVLLLACNGRGDDDVTLEAPSDSGLEDSALPTLGTTGGTTPTEQTFPDDVPVVGAPVVQGFQSGPLLALPAFAGTPVGGEAQLVRHVDGTAQVSVAATGLAPDTAHNAHVHVWPCSYEAGGHYKIDPSVVDTVDTNEVWPSFTTDADGRGIQSLELPGIRGEALSVIIHDPISGEKLACADLSPHVATGSQATGVLAPFAAYEAQDAGITGTVELTYASSSRLEVSVSGLDDGEQYKSHLHMEPCDVLDASGHYKIDPTVTETLDANEVWPSLQPSGGVASDTVTVTDHLIREDAQAVVIHRVAGVDVPKVACATLSRTNWLDRTSSGVPVPLPEAISRGLSITGRGSLLRRRDGVSVGDIELAGLEADAVHGIHLHNAPCDVLDGGGHYLIDPLGKGEDNELWLSLKTDGSGKGSRAVGVAHVARADALSYVVHAPDGARLACIDLE